MCRRTRSPARTVPCLGALAFSLALLSACDSVAPPSSPIATPADSSVAKPQPAQSFVPQIAFVSTRDGSPYIYLATAAGDSVVRLAMGENPAWIWNGTQIAFNGVTADGKGQELHVMPVDGAWDAVLPVKGTEPDWSPDGKSLLFAGPGGIYSAPTAVLLAGSGGVDSATVAFGSTLLVPGNFTEPGDQLHRPHWSPDGRSLVFVRVDTAHRSNIYVASADGSSPRRLVAGDAPRWSPDGLTIAFDLPGGVVATVNVDGSNLRGRTTAGSSSEAFTGDWSSDGTGLVFSKATEPSVMRIFILHLGNSAEAQLIPEAAHAASSNYMDFGAVWLRLSSPWDY